MAQYLALIALSLCGNLFKWKWIKINLGGECLLIRVPASALEAELPRVMSTGWAVEILMKGRLDWSLCAGGDKHRTSLLISCPISHLFIWILNHPTADLLLLSCYCLTSRIASWSKWNEIWHFFFCHYSQGSNVTLSIHICTQGRRVIPYFDQISYGKCHPLVFGVVFFFLDKKSILAPICLITWGSGPDVTVSRSFHRTFDEEAADVRSPYHLYLPDNWTFSIHSVGQSLRDI